MKNPFKQPKSDKVEQAEVEVEARVEEVDKKTKAEAKAYAAAKANLEEVTRRFMAGGCTRDELEKAKADAGEE